MNEFESYQSYWYFANSVRTKRRFVFDDKVNNFIKTVVETSKKRSADLKERQLLWRAQRGCNSRPYYQNDEYIADEEWPFSEKRMLPIQGRSYEGRANPSGITYLYLASDRNTACAEVRPWINSYISLAAFRTTRQLSLVDCRETGIKIRIFTKEPDPETRENCVWRDINNAFSRPVNPEDPETDYVPTQILAEAFLKSGQDGIAYKSSYEEGFNIVLFDVDNVEMVSCWLTDPDQLYEIFYRENDELAKSAKFWRLIGMELVESW